VVDEQGLPVEAGAVEIGLELILFGRREEDNVLADVQLEVAGDARGALIDIVAFPDFLDVGQWDREFPLRNSTSPPW